MSNAQLIAKLKALPASERKKVIRAAMPGAESAARLKRKKVAVTRKANWPDLSEMKREVFGERVVPNMVLVEREEFRY